MSVGDLILLGLLGAVVGVFGTLVGAGGGFILTPVLLVLYPTASPTTITSISLVVVFFNALSGSLAYARQRRIDYRSGAAFAAATIPGSILGALVVADSPRRLFDALTGLLLAGLAVWLLRSRKSDDRARYGAPVASEPSSIGRGPPTATPSPCDAESCSALGLDSCQVSSVSGVASSTFPSWSARSGFQPTSPLPHPISCSQTWPPSAR